MILGGIACAAAYTASGAVQEIGGSDINSMADVADYFGKTGQQLASQRYTPAEERTVLAERGTVLLSVLFPPFAIWTGTINTVHNVHYWGDHIERRGTFWHILDTAVNGVMVYGAAQAAPRWGAAASDAFSATRAKLSSWWANRNLACAPLGGPGGGGSGNTGGGQKYSNSDIEDIVKGIKGDGFKNNPLRQAYEKEVANLSKTGESLLNQGVPKEDVARTLHQMRRDLGVKYKDATPQPLRDYIYSINRGRYGDPLGPSFEKLYETKPIEQIIESSARSNLNIDDLLSGFEKWLRGQ